MKSLFPGFYDPTDEDITKLWQDSIFVFDTNMLLHVYRYSPEARERFFETLSLLKDRIWIPYQVAYEYQDRRLSVIAAQIQAYDTTIKLLDVTSKSLKTNLEQFKTRHTFIDPEDLTRDITKAFTDAKTRVQKAKDIHPDYKKKDPLRRRIEELFDDKIGKPYTKEQLEEKYKEAEKRFQRLIPPGFEDSGKKGVHKYGDVIVWFQLIDYACSKGNPIIFVTDDEKKDWWLTGEEIKGPLRPRPELIQEIFTEAHVPFYMYRGYVFMKKAEEFLKLARKPEVIQEIKDISEEVVAEGKLLEEEERRRTLFTTSSPTLRAANEIANSPTLRAASDLARIYSNLYFNQVDSPASGFYNLGIANKSEGEESNTNSIDEEEHNENKKED